MFEGENQMGLFEVTNTAPHGKAQEPRPASPPPAKAAHPTPAKTSPAPIKPVMKKSKPAVIEMAPAAKKVSGLVPEGDVRLTANIRQDLHLKLKIASAHRRTTIGEILEELIELHI